jgi:hypothetical protein
MTAALILRDIGALALQVAAIVAVGSAAWSLLRVRHSVLSHAYWRLLLLVCLLLPIAQPWHVTPPAAIDVAASAGEK